MPRFWTTERLLLRQLAPIDAPIVRDYGMRSREFHAPFDPHRPPGFWELGHVAERLGVELQDAAEDRGLTLYISLTDDPERIIGRVALLRIVRGSMQSCHVGYGLAPDAVGHGYMTEALGEAVRIAFEELGLHRIEANILPRNVRSINAAVRCGFEREGITRACYRIADRWEDHVRLAIVTTESAG